MSSHESGLKNSVRSLVFAIPGLKALYLRWVHGRKGIHQFEGWGMTTDSFPPWFSGADETARDFLKVHEEVLELVRTKRFRITQFDAMKKDTEEFLRELMWRHFMVFWTARYAKAASGKSIVESGVCDGLTVFFALRALENNRTAYLYDAWEGMEEKGLLKSEMKHLNDYAYLSLDTTKKNLEGLDTVYIKGFIPDSFKTAPSPTDVVWMHIDLNASLPTRATLEEFYDKMVSGSVILFDDYAGPAYKDTKKTVDEFFAGKDGILLHMPTGQAVFFKR